MQFNKAPISRVISTQAKDEATLATPPVYSAGGALAAGAVTLASGKAVTIFFDVPAAAMAANQINIKLHESGAGAGFGIHALPNVYLSDADSYLFIRGNSVVANDGTGIQVVYSAVIDNVSPAARLNDANGTWIRPGDAITIETPEGYLSNGGTVSSVSAQVITVRQQSQNVFLVDFTVGVRHTLLQNTGLTGWAKNELLFHTGTTAAPENVKGLSKDQLALGVTGTVGGVSMWRGRLRTATNLSYPSANKAGILTPTDAANTAVVSKAWLASSGIPSKVDKTLEIYSDIDYNSGQMPFKCVSIVDNTTTSAYHNLEISIIPLY